MNRKFLVLIFLIGIFGFGSATALVIPIGFTTSDNVKIYTKTTTFVAPFGVETAYQDFCDPGDTIINGYITDFIPPTNNDFNTGTQFAIKTATQEGFRILFVNDNGPTQDVEGTIVCGKVVQNNVIGGFLLQPDTTALFLAYGIANAVWLAPTLAGIGIGVYLTKSKWKKPENS